MRPRPRSPRRARSCATWASAVRCRPIRRISRIRRIPSSCRRRAISSTGAQPVYYADPNPPTPIGYVGEGKQCTEGCNMTIGGAKYNHTKWQINVDRRVAVGRSEAPRSRGDAAAGGRLLSAARRRTRSRSRDFAGWGDAHEAHPGGDEDGSIQSPIRDEGALASCLVRSELRDSRAGGRRGHLLGPGAAERAPDDRQLGLHERDHGALRLRSHHLHLHLRHHADDGQRDGHAERSARPADDPRLRLVGMSIRDQLEQLGLGGDAERDGSSAERLHHAAVLRTDAQALHRRREPDDLRQQDLVLLRVRRVALQPQCVGRDDA